MKVEQINQNRENYKQEQDFRAKERNKYRTLSEKMFFKEKVTGMDMMIEDAIKMDEMAEKLITEGKAKTFTKAIEAIEQDEEFSSKSKDSIKREEYARSRALYAGKKLYEGEIYKTYRIINHEEFRKGTDAETRELIDKYFTPFVKQKVMEDITGEKGEQLVKMLSYFSDYIKREDFKNIPDNILKSPEIIKNINHDLISWFNTFSSQPGTFKRGVNKYIRLGFISYGDIVKLPEIQEKARKEAISWFQTFSSEPETFAKIWRGFINMGIINMEEIVNLPEIQEKAKKEAISWFNAFPGETKTFSRIWEGFENMNIMTIKDIVKLPEIKEKAKKELLSWLRYGGDKDFEKRSKIYLNLGIVDESDIDKIIMEQEKK